MPLSVEDPVAEARARARALAARLSVPSAPPVDQGAGRARMDRARPRGAQAEGSARPSAEAARARLAQALAPGSEEAPDEDLCRALLAELAGAGLLGYVVPAPWGGHQPQVGVQLLAAVRAELAYHSGLLDVLFVLQGLGSFPITLAGSEEQKKRYLPGVASGASVAAFAVTEPEAGSDVGAIRTRARREGDDYVLDGVKTFISNAPFADLFTIIAQADPSKGRKGLTAFVVERASSGLETRADIDLIAPHPIGTVILSDCRVGQASRLGQEGEGFAVAMATLDRFRTTVGAAAVGFARRALDEALSFARTRVQFGRPIAEFEGIQFKLADMATTLDAARLLVERAAASADRANQASGAGMDRLADLPGSRTPEGGGDASVGSPASKADEPARAGGRSWESAAGGAARGPAPNAEPGPPKSGARSYALSPLPEDAGREASMAKLFATEAAQQIVDEALQIHGGRGLVRGNIVESLYREVRALRIYEGTSEIQRTVIGKSLIAG